MLGSDRGRGGGLLIELLASGYGSSRLHVDIVAADGAEPDRLCEPVRPIVEQPGAQRKMSAKAHDEKEAAHRRSEEFGARLHGPCGETSTTRRLPAYFGRDRGRLSFRHSPGLRHEPACFRSTFVMMAPRPLIAFTVVCVLACASSRAFAQGEMAAMDHSKHRMGPEIVVPKGALYTKADVEFMQGMIAHHAQAIVMSRMAEANGANPQVLKLSRKIDQAPVPAIIILH